MAKDLNFSSDELLNVKFKALDRGYDPYQVDELLDRVIEDYRKIEDSVDQTNMEFQRQIDELRRINLSLSQELEKEKNRVKYLPRDQKEVHIDNYELLQRIGKLEMIIFEKLNMNPDDIK